MSTVTVRLNSEEAKIYKEYAKFKKVPISTLMKEALNEKIEDEIDLKSIMDYERKVADSEVEYIPLEEIKKGLDT